MKVESFEARACCGGKSFTLKIDKPVTLELLNSIKAWGYRESEHFTKSGILYLDDSYLVISSPFGSSKLSVKCRKKDCEKNINDFKQLLTSL